MYVGLDNFGDTPGQEVPNDDPSIIASDGQEGPEAIEVQSQCHGDAVQSSIILLRIILTERLQKFQIHDFLTFVKCICNLPDAKWLGNNVQIVIFLRAFNI